MDNVDHDKVLKFQHEQACLLIKEKFGHDPRLVTSEELKKQREEVYAKMNSVVGRNLGSVNHQSIRSRFRHLIVDQVPPVYSKPILTVVEAIKDLTPEDKIGVLDTAYFADIVMRGINTSESMLDLPDVKGNLLDSVIATNDGSLLFSVGDENYTLDAQDSVFELKSGITVAVDYPHTKILSLSTGMKSKVERVMENIHTSTECTAGAVETLLLDVLPQYRKADPDSGYHLFDQRRVSDRDEYSLSYITESIIRAIYSRDASVCVVINSSARDLHYWRIVKKSVKRRYGRSLTFVYDPLEVASNYSPKVWILSPFSHFFGKKRRCRFDDDTTMRKEVTLWYSALFEFDVTDELERGSFFFAPFSVIPFWYDIRRHEDTFSINYPRLTEFVVSLVFVTPHRLRNICILEKEVSYLKHQDIRYDNFSIHRGGDLKLLGHIWERVGYSAWRNGHGSSTTQDAAFFFSISKTFCSYARKIFKDKDLNLKFFFRAPVYFRKVRKVYDAKSGLVSFDMDVGISALISTVFKGVKGERCSRHQISAIMKGGVNVDAFIDYCVLKGVLARDNLSVAEYYYYVGRDISSFFVGVLPEPDESTRSVIFGPDGSVGDVYAPNTKVYKTTNVSSLLRGLVQSEKILPIARSRVTLSKAPVRKGSVYRRDQIRSKKPRPGKKKWVVKGEGGMDTLEET